MIKNLVIVESPAKAKTIEKYLGPDYSVMSSVGHIRSIIKKSKTSTPPIDINNGFTPQYEIDSDKKKTVAELRKASKQAETIWLATDEDREGEAIAWHLCEVLKLDPTKTKRIVFHEITKDAITQAIKNPRHVDMDLVRAQQARQIMDRLVGFELSPVVWQKVPGGKSAGRVQSPAVRLIVEREREIMAHEADFSFRIKSQWLPANDNQAEVIEAEFSRRPKTEAEAHQILEQINQPGAKVSDVSKSPGVRNPSSPFTTSTLQQEANSRLGFSSKSTMASAQRLYQAGKITYMRTDSVNLSAQALNQIGSYIESSFGPNYHKRRTFKTKSASAQEAHEAIRPTDISLQKASSDSYDQKLYELIRGRTLASQMAPAKLEKTVISIEVPGIQDPFEAKGEVIIFDGFLKAYKDSKFRSSLLPAVHSGQELLLKEATARQTFSRPPARYSEGSLVKKLEELGIGRPSTYATILSTIQARGYAERGESEGQQREVIVLSLNPASERLAIERQIENEKSGSDKGKLVPSPIGFIISDFLKEHFSSVVDYGFTANVEQDFDKIASGKLVWNNMLKQFYGPFHQLIKSAADISRAAATKAREVGIDPKTNKPIIARLGRFGPMLQLGDGSDKDEKPRFASLPKGAKLETVTLEQALKAFDLPRSLGTASDGQEIKANIGRFGPYIQIGKIFVSIKPHDPFTITLSEAQELYDAKLKQLAEKQIADFGKIQILNGPFGPYVTDGNKNARIDKKTDPKSLTKEAAEELLASAKTRPKRGAKKTTAKKAKTTTRKTTRSKAKK